MTAKLFPLSPLCLCFLCVTAHAQDPAPPNLAGTWAQQQVTHTITDVAIAGEIRSTTTSLLLLDVTQKGATLSVTERLCDVHIKSEFDKLRTIIPQRFLHALSGTTRQVTLKRKGDAWTYTQHPRLVVQGATLKDPKKDALPKDEDDPRLTDPDGDGKPGLTVLLRGIIDGEVYLVQRGWNKLVGTLTGTTRIKGEMVWAMEQSVVDASRLLLDSTPKTRREKGANQHTFAMVKVKKGTSCSALRSGATALFK